MADLEETIDSARKAENYLRYHSVARNWPRLQECAQIVQDLSKRVESLISELYDEQQRSLHLQTQLEIARNPDRGW